MSTSLHSSRKHSVPTHLQLPDQVLTLWSFNMTARQLLLALIGAGMSGNLWHDVAFLSAIGIPGVGMRALLAVLPFLLALVIAYAQYHGRSLELWFIVWLRYALQPKCYVWRTIRTSPKQIYPLLASEEDATTAKATLGQHRRFVGKEPRR
jgi:hypothetical protein